MLVVLFIQFPVFSCTWLIFLPQRRLSLKFLELGITGIKTTVMSPSFTGQWKNTNLVLDYTSPCEGTHLSDTQRISLFLLLFPNPSFHISLSSFLFPPLFLLSFFTSEVRLYPGCVEFVNPAQVSLIFDIYEICS